MFWATKPAHWINRWRHPKNERTATVMTSSIKNAKLKTTKKLLWILNYKTFQIFRGFEQLSSLIVWRVMAFSLNDQGYLLWDLIFISNFWFVSHNFGSRKARKPITYDLKTWMIAYFPKNTSVTKMAHWFGCQGHKTRIFVKNVCIHRPVTCACFLLTYIYMGWYRKCYRDLYQLQKC